MAATVICRISVAMPSAQGGKENHQDERHEEPSDAPAALLGVLLGSELPAGEFHQDVRGAVDAGKVSSLLESRDVAWKGEWKTFREMPWGEMYITPYTGRVLTRAAFTLGTRIGKFRTAAEKMGAEPVPHGDAGFRFTLVGGYEMQILVREGDEEFTPSAQVLYSDNFAEGFAAEDRVVAGDILISTLKANM